jgi:1,4-alpha-glucan branching enzyme
MTCKAEYVPLTKESAWRSIGITTSSWTTAPSSARTRRNRTWQILQPMLPLLFKAIEAGQVPPDMILQVLKYSPLPASMVNAWQKMAEQIAQKKAQEPPQPSPEEIKAAQEQQKFQLDMAGKQADMAADQQKNDADVSMKLLDAFLKQHQAENDIAIDNATTENEAARLAIQARQNEIRAQNANSTRTSSAS